MVSRFVFNEAGRGNPRTARNRLAALAPRDVLESSANVTELARGLIPAHAMLSQATQDEVYVAIAVVNSVGHLMAWNLRHIANPKPVPRIEQFCRANGYTPTVVRPPSQVNEAQRAGSGTRSHRGGAAGNPHQDGGSLRQ